METLKDEDIISEQEPQETLSEDDIIEETPPDGLFNKVINKITPSHEKQQWFGDQAKSIGEGIQDFSQGFVGGGSLGSIDELGGLAGAATEEVVEESPFLQKTLSGIGKGLSYLTGDKSFEGGDVLPYEAEAAMAKQDIVTPQESFVNKYRTYQQGIEQAQDASSKRSSFLHGAGNIGGGIASSIALGNALGIGANAKKAESIFDIARNSGKLKALGEVAKRGGYNYLKAAPGIALEGALISKEHLIGPDSDLEGVGADVGGNLAFGLPAIMGMQGVSDVVMPGAKHVAQKVGDKIAKYINESPQLRQMGISYDYGRIHKVNPTDPEAIKSGVEGVHDGTKFSLLNANRAKELTFDVLEKDKKLGEHVGQSLDLSKGIRINAEDILDKTHTKIEELSKVMPELLYDKGFTGTMNSIFSRDFNSASPRDIKNAIEAITNEIDRIGTYNFVSPELQEAPKLLRVLRKELDQRLKEKVKPYAEAAQRFNEFRKAYLEQPIAGKRDPELYDDFFYGDLKGGQEKLANSYKNLITDSTGNSAANETAEEALGRYNESINKFQQQELARQSAGQIKAPITQDPNKLLGKIQNYADDAIVRRDSRKTQDSQAGGKSFIKTLFGFGQTGRGTALSTAHYTGRAVGSYPVQGVIRVGKNISAAPRKALTELAESLEKNPKLASIGKHLREGLESGDNAKKNAALFLIMQNPNAKLLISHEDVDHEQGE